MQTVSYRLADALPRGLDARRLAAPGSARRQRVEALIDEGYGACILREPDIAKLVVGAWRHFDGRRYRLHAWVVMPNHVHLVATTVAGFPLARVVRDWKSFTAHAIAKQRKSGPVWQPGYWDRFIRDEDHYAAAVEYVEHNPVKAGLVSHAEAWPWSSAAIRRAGGTPALPDADVMRSTANLARRALGKRWPTR